MRLLFFFSLFIISQLFNEVWYQVKYDVKCNNCGHENPQWIKEKQDEIVNHCAKLKTALAYAKNIKTDVSGPLDPNNVKNIESQIKSMTGYDLNKMTREIEKRF